VLGLVGMPSWVWHLRSYISYLSRNANVIITTKKEYSSNQHGSGIISSI
jgi:hypothetical protein